MRLKDWIIGAVLIVTSPLFIVALVLMFGLLAPFLAWYTKRSDERWGKG